MRQRYTIVIERAPGNYSAYVPDVPGCMTTGQTVEETRRNMVEALTMHLEVMQEYGDALPDPLTHPSDVRPLAADDVIATVEVELPDAVAV